MSAYLLRFDAQAARRRREALLQPLLHGRHSASYLRGLALGCCLAIIGIVYALLFCQWQSRRGAERAALPEALQRLLHGKARRQRKLH